MMKQPEGFLKAMRSQTLFDLLRLKPNVFHLLFFIAYTLNRDGSPNLYGSKQGESRVSFKACGLTDSQYRSAKKYLQEMGLAVFVTRGHGKGKKAYARLTNTNLFDPNISPNEFPIKEYKPPNSDLIATSKSTLTNNCYPVDYEEKTTNQNPNNDAISTLTQHDNECKSNEEQEERIKKEEKRRVSPQVDKQKLSSPINKTMKSGKLLASAENLKLAEALYQSILRVHPDTRRPANFTGWALEIERIIHIDGKSIERVQEIIEYLPYDAFWCNQVLSGNKLRKQFEKLEQAKFENETRKSTSPNRFSSKIEWAKQQCHPVFENNKNAFFSFRDHFIMIGDRRKKETTYTEIYFSSNGFEDQLNNALRKWGFK